MSRVLLLNISEAEAAKACGDQDVAISVLEKLDSGGVRLVCVSADGAAAMRHKLRTKLIDGPVKRSRVYARGMQPYHSDAPQDVRSRPFASERGSR
jgi:hypothetical protein